MPRKLVPLKQPGLSVFNGGLPATNTGMAPHGGVFNPVLSNPPSTHVLPKAGAPGFDDILTTGRKVPPAGIGKLLSKLIAGGAGVLDFLNPETANPPGHDPTYISDQPLGPPAPGQPPEASAPEAPLSFKFTPGSDQNSPAPLSFKFTPGSDQNSPASQPQADIGADIGLDPIEPPKKKNAATLKEEGLFNAVKVADAANNPFSLGEMKNLIGSQFASPELDLSSLAALVDAQTGSNFRQAYANRETPARRRNAFINANLQAETLGQNQQKIDAAALKSLLDRKALIRAAKIKAGAPGTIGESGKRRLAAIEDKVRKHFLGFDEEISGVAGPMKSIVSALNTGEIGKVNGILAQIVRKISGEQGTLAEGDIRRVMMSDLRNMLAKFNVFFNDDGTVKQQLSPGRLQDLKFLVRSGIQGFRDAAGQRLSSSVEQFKQSSAVREFGLDIDKLSSGTTASLKNLGDIQINESGPKTTEQFTDAELDARLLELQGR